MFSGVNIDNDKDVPYVHIVPKKAKKIETPVVKAAQAAPVKPV